MWLVLALIGLKLTAELYLAWLNRRHVLAHAEDVPEGFRDVVDLPTYKRSVTYALAKKSPKPIRNDRRCRDPRGTLSQPGTPEDLRCVPRISLDAGGVSVRRRPRARRPQPALGLVWPI